MGGIFFMWAIFFFISLLGWGIAIKALMPAIKLGVSIFCAFISMLLFSYTSMIVFGIFAPSAYLLIWGGIIAFVVVGVFNLYKYQKGQSGILEKEDLFVVLVYGVCAVGFVAVLSDGTLKAHDAYSFWARAARELYLFNKGYFNADTNIAHWDYNPIFATLQYAITKVFGWSTKYLYFVIIGCFVASMCAIMDSIKAGYKAKIVFLILTVFFYPSIAMTYSTAFLGADGSMALLFVVGVLSWCGREKNDFISALPVVLSAIILPAVKLYSGLMLAAVLIIMIGISFWKNRDRYIKISLLAMIIGVLYMQFSWSAYYNYNADKAAFERRVANYEYQGIENDISSEEPHFKISYFFKGNPRTKQLSTDVNGNTISEMIVLSKSSIKMLMVGSLYNSPMSITTMVLLTIIAYLFLAREEKKVSERRMKNTAIWLLVAAVIYICGMFGTYIVQPGTANEPIRYVGVVVIPMVISLLYYACEYWGDQREQLSGISKNILLAVMLILVLGSNSLRLWNAYSADESLEYQPAAYARNMLENEFGVITDYVSNDERILIIDNKKENAGLGDSGVVYAYQYYMLPSRGRMLYFDFGDKGAAESMTDEYLEAVLLQSRIDVMAIVADGEEIRERLSSILGIYIESGKTYLINVEVQDGNIEYTLRKK